MEEAFPPWGKRERGLVNAGSWKGGMLILGGWRVKLLSIKLLRVKLFLVVK